MSDEERLNEARRALNRLSDRIRFADDCSDVLLLADLVPAAKILAEYIERDANPGLNMEEFPRCERCGSRHPQK